MPFIPEIFSLCCQIEVVGGGLLEFQRQEQQSDHEDRQSERSDHEQAPQEQDDGKVFYSSSSSSSDFLLTCRYRGHIHNSGPPSRQLACCTHGRSHTRSPGVSIMRVDS